MADLPSGDGPVTLANGTIDGREKSIATGLDEQTIADADQTFAGTDQTLADADQTSADGDQASSENDQFASDRDQAASDRDLARGVDPGDHEFTREIRERTSRQRELTAQARLEAASERDAIAHTRDIAALARDHAATARDLAMAQLDAAYQRAGGGGSVTGAEIVVRAADQRRRAAQQRVQAAQHRESAARDRQAAAHDRAQAAAERRQAVADREAFARELAIAAIDPLTGARARAAGLAELDHELARCRRTGGRLVVAFVDIVGLKPLNDHHGHVAGDELLKRVVALIKENIRPYDLVIRLGGDEFLCVMSNETVPVARERFSAIAAALAASPGAGAIRTGFAELTADETATALIARADGEMIASRRP